MKSRTLALERPKLPSDSTLLLEYVAGCRLLRATLSVAHVDSYGRSYVEHSGRGSIKPARAGLIDPQNRFLVEPLAPHFANIVEFAIFLGGRLPPDDEDFAWLFHQSALRVAILPGCIDHGQAVGKPGGDDFPQELLPLIVVNSLPGPGRQAEI